MIRFIDRMPENFAAIRRREWLRIAAGSLLGGLGARAEIPPPTGFPGFGRAKSVIVVFANGGQSQFETFDPKPDAPEQIRGEFGSIATSVPGLRFTEHLPRLARLASRFTVLRAVSHDDLDHGSATYLTLTGRFHTQKSANPAPSPTDFPTLGAVLERVRPSRKLPYTAIHVNGPAIVPELPAPGQNGGFLGREYEPLLVGDPTSGDTPLPDLSPSDGGSLDRRATRRRLLEALDRRAERTEFDHQLRDLDEIYRQAYALLEAPRIRDAFRIGDEPDAIRDRYGRHRPGQACLLARRLAEAEVPLITVMWNHSGRGQDTRPDDAEAYGWDTHNDIFGVMRERLLPRFDLSLSALIEDLDARGLLEQTLVVVMGEFGRAPRVALEPKFAGASPGRKHWANVYSTLMMGAGVERGGVFGASDEIGAYPKEGRVAPWDIAATIFAALGIDPESEYRDAIDRPFLATLGRPISAIFRGGTP
jgi:hypothetical protein